MVCGESIQDGVQACCEPGKRGLPVLIFPLYGRNDEHNPQSVLDGSGYKRLLNVAEGSICFGAEKIDGVFGRCLIKRYRGWPCLLRFGNTGLPRGFKPDVKPPFVRPGRPLFLSDVLFQNEVLWVTSPD